MTKTLQLRFADFVLDGANAQLWRAGVSLKLRPKAFEVLRHLAEHAGQLVTKDELLSTVWPGLVVGDANLQLCLSEIRKVLDESPKAPRFIETVHRRGYRFRLDPETVNAPAALAEVPLRPIRPPFVGREVEIDTLAHALRAAREGRRQVVFVSGDPGIGKTSLVDQFLAQLSPRAMFWIGLGQCVTRFGAEVAYLPILDALSGLVAQAPDRIRSLLQVHAPAWATQMLGMMTLQERATAQSTNGVPSTERLLRELAEAIETLATERVVVLWLDDLHDCDSSTLELIGYLARRKPPARLLLIGTYRSAEVVMPDHPFRKIALALRERELGREMVLAALSATAVETYLRARLPALDSLYLTELAGRMHARTEGNPLFITHVTDDLLDTDEGVTRLKKDHAARLLSIPAKLEDLLRAQIQMLPAAELEALEAASVDGVRFSVQTLSSVRGIGALELEALLERLSNAYRFVQPDTREKWPDGTQAHYYRFRHALHQEAVYRRIPDLRRERLHQLTGESKERSHAGELGAIAAELASHFEHSRDYPRTLRYCLMGCEQALQRSAFVEGMKLVERGLNQLQHLPAGAQRDQAELRLRMAATVCHATSVGAASREAGAACHRALELCRQIDDDIDLFPVLAGLFAFYLVKARYDTAEEIGARLLRLASSHGSAHLALAARVALGMVTWHLGKLDSARSHFAQRSDLYHAHDHLKFLQFGHDCAVTSLSLAAPVYWYLGYPDQARRLAEEGIELARELSHAYSQGVALLFGARPFQECGQVSRAAQLVEEHAKTCSGREFTEADARRQLSQGWVWVQQGRIAEGIASLRAGLDTCNRLGTGMEKPYHLTVLAQAHARAGVFDKGLEILDEALRLSRETGEAYYQAEMHRVRATMFMAMLEREPDSLQLSEEIESALLQSLQISRDQQARSLELRAAMTQVRWRQRLASAGGADSVLALQSASETLRQVYLWFTEGFDTQDLQDAKAMLRQA